ncbi:SGNH/GDSL hydrolase family protein [Paramicrobacterium chengjingii]|uniref:SGNH/GDSL hydrolase family protein n=1 Tax=Paramicrobacterium chengjingii TaxID=2769067 RepID=A0ABX6YK56_9MICO|nr:SGNH/GDSL hydrolase family protein [Microbacterium chengjingii]QPZ38732.1 SGNH/GDSL hydrolase family protein [Microbacterium chengjingii]
MTNPMLEKLVRFQNPEQQLGYARELTDDTRAALVNATTEEYRRQTEQLTMLKEDAAQSLARQEEIQRALVNTPFSRAQRILALGESSTADALSWFEILRTLFAHERADLNLEFQNLAISGATSTQVLGTVSRVARAQADWIFCMLGGNDARRFGDADGPRLVSEAETLRNLTLIRRLAVAERDVRWFWLTPTPVDEEKVAAYPYFAGIAWANHDVQRITHALTERNDPVIDSSTSVLVADAYGDDGLHTTISAQTELARKVLTTLEG